jgi:DNA repair protein RadC
MVLKPETQNGIPEDLLDFLAQSAAYPFMSRKGRIFFRSEKKLENIPLLVEQLLLRTDEDCRNLRKVVSERRSRMRQSLPIRSWIAEERPREMLMEKGAENLSSAKLLAIILRTGKEGASAEEIAMRLINRFGGLRELDAARVSEICEIDGIGPAKAAQIKAALEIGKRMLAQKARKGFRQIRKVEDVLKYVGESYGPYLRDARQEFFKIILLDIKNKPLKSLEISRGSVSASIVDPRDIIKEAALNSASAVILVHNHPSGETDPSPEDVRITSQVKDACRLVGIKVLDHVIIGRDIEDYFSFAARNLL